MADIVTPEVRSRMMSGIRGRDTKPEMLLRRGLHAMGLRFRLQDRTLPGKPDLVFPRHRAAVFAHGCFWHGHDCPLFKMPSSRTEFWEAKISGNRARDLLNLERLKSAGWRTLTVWECATRGPSRLPLEKVLEESREWILSDRPAVQIRGND